MKNIYFIFALALLFGTTLVYGRQSISNTDAVLTDSLQKSKIRYFSPGRGGRNLVWDFSKKLGSRESAQVMFMTDSTNVLTVTEPGKISYYRTTLDSLVLFGSESPLEKREYAINKVAKKFPLVFGDSISNPFRCEVQSKGQVFD